MKGAWLAIWIVLFSLKGYSQEISFSETYYDLGTVGIGDSLVYHDFYFMNTGEGPLLIKGIWVSCGCIASEYPRDTILQGEKACVRLSYIPGHRDELSFLKMAEVTTNAGVVELRIAGNVARDEEGFTTDYELSPESKPVTRKMSDDVYEVIMKRMRAGMLGQLNIGKNDSLALAYVNTLRRGGYWPEIDYRCYSRQDWEPIRHLNKVYHLVVSYVTPQSRYYGNDTLYTALRDALAYWVKMSPRCHNWWLNEIAVPQSLGNMLVLLESGEKQLPDDLQNGLFRMMAWPDPRKWTGANKQDIALHHLQRGCLLRNDSIVRVAVSELFYPIRITAQEGIQADLSYQQHGNQLYIGGYGSVFVGCVLRTAEWVKNTPYALQAEQLKLFSEFMRLTYLNVFRGPYIDFSVLGRGISRKGAQYQGNMSGILRKMMLLDPLHAREYEEAIPRFEGYSDSCRNACSRVYWRSDYALHNRKKYDFSVRTSSVRTRKIEFGNGENLKGGLLSDGATAVRMKGNEYFNYFPFWAWNQVPGVTAPEKVNLQPGAWGTKGKSTFSGGVSDGRYSVMAYVMNDFGVKARKAWFMFDREIVCLGAGICGNGVGKIQTTVEQCPDKKELWRDTTALIHNRVLYYFPQHAPFLYTQELITGSWFDINNNYTGEKPKSVANFRLWLEHGENPQDEKYAYFIVPDVEKRSDYDAGKVQVLKNEKSVQAVYQQELDILQVVFYEAASLSEGGIYLKADIPCVIMVSKLTSRYPEIRVADPVQDKEKVNIHFKNNYSNITRSVKLPRGDMKGSTVKI